jgi:alpha-tubulin suppressor-like RCC1 family protein
MACRYGQRCKPTKVEFGRAITMIAAGEQHTIAVDSEGSLYGWGFNQVSMISSMGLLLVI